MFRIVIEPSALKESIELLEPEQFLEALEKIAREPRSHGALKLRGQGKTYRIRMGDYRILYEINDKDKEVCLLRVAHRREVYR